MMNFVHRSTSMSGEIRQGTFADVKSEVTRSARDGCEAAGAPLSFSSPTTSSPRPECFTWPGSGSAAATYTTAGRASMPDAARIRATLSTPFCKLTTTAPLARCGASDRAASSVSVVFTQNRITSASRAADTSTEAPIATRPWKKAASRKSPPARIASTWAGRAINVTCEPARASMPPKYEPTAPAPSTATRTCESVEFIGMIVGAASLHSWILRLFSVLEMASQFTKAGKNQKLSRAALQLAFFKLPGGRVRNEYRAQSGMKGGVDIAARAVAHHPAVRFHNFKLFDHAFVQAWVFFQHDFDGVEIRLQTGALDFCSLLGGLALGQQNQTMMFREVGKGFGDAIENMWRSGLEFRSHSFDFLNQLALRSVPYKFQVCFFKRAAKAAHSVAVLADVPSFGFVQDVADIFAGITKMLELRNKVVDSLFKKNVVFPEGVVRIDEYCVPRHTICFKNSPKLKNDREPSSRKKLLCYAGVRNQDSSLRAAPVFSSGGFARTGCDLLQNCACDVLHLAETREVILKLAVQIERSRRIELCSQDHIAQVNGMRQYRIVPQFIQCHIRVVVIHVPSHAGQRNHILPCFDKIVRVSGIVRQRREEIRSVQCGRRRRGVPVVHLRARRARSNGCERRQRA